MKTVTAGVLTDHHGHAAAAFTIIRDFLFERSDATARASVPGTRPCPAIVDGRLYGGFGGTGPEQDREHQGQKLFQQGTGVHGSTLVKALRKGIGSNAGRAKLRPVRLRRG
jgi:hypothetical protein